MEACRGGGAEKDLLFSNSLHTSFGTLIVSSLHDPRLQIEKLISVFYPTLIYGPWTYYATKHPLLYKYELI